MRRRTNTFIVVYFTIQALLPVPGLLEDGVERRGRFSWNMYANANKVQARYVHVAADGKRRSFNYKRYFNSRHRATLVHHRVTLPRFHAFLCEELRIEEEGGKLLAKVTRWFNDWEPQILVAYGEDLCTAPNYAVLPRPSRAGP